MRQRVFGLLPLWVVVPVFVGTGAWAIWFQQQVFAPRTDAFRDDLRATGEPVAFDDLCNPILDTRFGYSAGTVRRLFGGLGNDGRERYRATELSDDILFPWVYCTFFASLLGAAYCRVLSPRRQRWLLLIPAVTLLADHGENLMIAFVLIPDWQTVSPPVVGIAAAFTVVKWSLVVITFGVAAVGFFLTARDRVLRAAP